MVVTKEAPINRKGASENIDIEIIVVIVFKEGIRYGDIVRIGSSVKDDPSPMNIR